MFQHYRPYCIILHLYTHLKGITFVQHVVCGSLESLGVTLADPGGGVDIGYVHVLIIVVCNPMYASMKPE